MSALTPSQERFCEEFLIDLNASAAYRRAGYKAVSESVASACSSRLLRNAKVAARIAELKTARSERVKVDADNVLRELLLIAHSDIGEVIDFSGDEPKLRAANEIPVSARKAISSFKVKRYLEGRGEDAREVEVTEFKLWDKLSAIDKLAKQCGLLVEQHEHEHKHTHEHSVTARIAAAEAAHLAAFEGAADREETGAVSGDGARKPVDTRRGQEGADAETD